MASLPTVAPPHHWHHSVAGLRRIFLKKPTALNNFISWCSLWFQPWYVFYSWLWQSSLFFATTLFLPGIWTNLASMSILAHAINILHAIAHRCPSLERPVLSTSPLPCCHILTKFFYFSIVDPKDVLLKTNWAKSSSISNLNITFVLNVSVVWRIWVSNS